MSEALPEELTQGEGGPARGGPRALRGFGQAPAAALCDVHAAGWTNADEGDGMWEQIQ